MISLYFSSIVVIEVESRTYVIGWFSLCNFGNKYISLSLSLRLVNPLLHSLKCFTSTVRSHLSSQMIHYECNLHNLLQFGINRWWYIFLIKEINEITAVHWHENASANPSLLSQWYFISLMCSYDSYNSLQSSHHHTGVVESLASIWHQSICNHRVHLQLSFLTKCSSVIIPLAHCDGFLHYNDVTMGAIESQITSLTSVYSTIYSEADQRKHQSSASLAFVRNSPVTDEFPAQMASDAENASIWLIWYHSYYT